jgi:TRAP-type C4-dicarboxylate transport system permease large subunit
VYALLLAMVIYRELSIKDLYPIFVNSARTSAVVMFLVAAAMVSAWLITVADLPSQLVSLVEPLIGDPMLLMAVVKAAGIDPDYFGVLFIINNAIGLVTPPVGTVLNVVAGVGRMSMDDVTKGVFPFVVAEFSIMLLMVLFLQWVMWLAKFFGG